MTTTHSGNCLCKGVQFTIQGELAPIQICHCSICRQAQGGPFATNIPVERPNITFHSGQELMKGFESSPGKRRVFCSACGTPLFSERTAAPEVIRIRAGLLAEPVHTRVGFHIYQDSHASWWPADDNLPVYPEGHTG